MQQYRFAAEQHKLFGCIASKPSARSSGYDNDVSLHKALELPVGGETYYPRKECFVFGVFENVQFFESQTTKVFHLTLRIVDACVFGNDIVNKCLVVDVDVVFVEYIDDVYSFFFVCRPDGM